MAKPIKKVTISFEVTYRFSGKLLKEYLEQLGDYPDTDAQRKWFIEDRFISPAMELNGQEVYSFDPKAKLKFQITK